MKIKKIIKMIAVIISIAIIILTSMYMKTYATTFSITEADLYSKGYCKSLLKNYYTGGTIKVAKVFYKSGGVEYPAYCLDVDLDGVGTVDGYTVTVDKLVDNDLVRRVIINGYPYKSIDDLGLEDVDEAFTATKMAVYCVLYDYDLDDYEKFEAIGTAGKRTLKAIKSIVTAARKSTDTKQDASIYIEEVSEDWEIDSNENTYISKQYVAKSNVDIKQFTLSIENSTISGIKLTDLNNTEMTTFKNDTKFKVLVPIEELTEKGQFDIDIEGQIETKPILYGKAPSSNLQNYALTALSYEIGYDTLQIEYPKNETTITFEKLSYDSSEALEGAKFNIYDENQKLVYENLVTDKDGLVTIEGILPGTYYIEEVEAPNGYNKYEGLIKFTIDYQEEKLITITNNKVKVISRVTVNPKLPVTGF